MFFSALIMFYQSGQMFNSCVLKFNLSLHALRTYQIENCLFQIFIKQLTLHSFWTQINATADLYACKVYENHKIVKQQFYLEDARE